MSEDMRAVPEHLRPLAPGYTARQIAIDAEMVAIGRPSATLRTVLNRALLAIHRAAVEAWERENPDGAARWLELRMEAQAEESKLYSERYGPEAFARERMRVAGFSEALTARAMRELRDSACFTATRDWLRDGLTWSLLMTGTPGCGKSQAATWAAFQLLSRGFGVRCARCPRLSESPLYGMEAEEERWRCTQAGVLVLDDLGEGEQRGERRSAWRAWVDDVLTQRHAANRRTITTTNRSPDELGAWLGARLVDRLNEGIIISTNEPTLRGPPPPRPSPKRFDAAAARIREPGED